MSRHLGVTDHTGSRSIPEIYIQIGDSSYLTWGCGVCFPANGFAFADVFQRLNAARSRDKDTDILDYGQTGYFLQWHPRTTHDG